jgi:hypothetical protein
MAAAELRDFFWKIVNYFRVFSRKALYRWRGDVRGGIGPPRHTVWWPYSSDRIR